MLVSVEETSQKYHLDIFTPGGLRNKESYLQGLFFEHHLSNINGSKTSNKITMLKDMDFQIKDMLASLSYMPGFLKCNFPQKDIAS